MSNKDSNNLFHNRYKLIERVGVGGMSEVWTAKDLNGAEEEVIAIKIFSSDSDKNSLRNEYALMRRFNHPNLLRPDYFDVDESTNSPFMVMKYYSNGSATNIINDSNFEIKAIEENLIAHFIISASNALITIQNHQSRIVHQDIKPDNFLIDENNIFVLADFGVSTRKQETRIIQRKEEETKFAGAIPYVAPERFAGAPPRPSQDIFSLGVTVYEILTGVLPFQEHGGIRLTQGFPVPDLDPAFGYSSRLNSLCKRCMDLEPEARPTANELKDWSQFYIKNGYWPEIPQIDIKEIKAEKLYRNTQLTYEKIIGSKLNEIDKVELSSTENNFRQINSLTNQYSEINDFLIKLHDIREKLLQFEKLEIDFNNIKNQRFDKSTINEFKNRYISIASTLSTFYFDKRIGEINELISKANNFDDIEIKIKSYLSYPIDKLFSSEAKLFLEEIKNIDSLKQQTYNLEEHIAKSEEFKKLKSQCEAELAKSIDLIDIEILEEYLFRLNKFDGISDSDFLKKIESKITTSQIFQSGVKQIETLEDINQFNELSSKQKNSYKKQLEDILRDFKHLKKSINSILDIQKIEEQILILNGYKKSIQESEDTSTSYQNAKNLFNEAKNLLFLVQNETETEFEFKLHQIKNSIEKFKKSLTLSPNEEVDCYLTLALQEKESIVNELNKNKNSDEIVTKVVTISTDEKKNYVIIINQADQATESVDFYLHKKEFNTQTLKEHLKIIEEAITKYSEALSSAPSVIGKKRKRAIGFKEIILEELRKKRRGILFWFLKGAAVFGILIIMIFFRENIISLFQSRRTIISEKNPITDTLAAGKYIDDDQVPLDTLEIDNKESLTKAKDSTNLTELKQIKDEGINKEKNDINEKPITENNKIENIKDEKKNPLTPIQIENKDNPNSNISTKTDPIKNETANAERLNNEINPEIDWISIEPAKPNPRHCPIKLSAMTTGNIVSYHWEKMSKGGDIKTNGYDNKDLIITKIKPGLYKFKVTIVGKNGTPTSKEITFTADLSNKN